MGAVPIVASVKLASDWPAGAHAFCECHTGECKQGKSKFFIIGNGTIFRIR